MRKHKFKVTQLWCFLLSVCSVVWTDLNAQYLFEGIAPQTYRDKVVHLDIIDGWNDFDLIADYQHLSETKIDSSGSYRLTGSGLPLRRGFYRLRFRDPVSDGTTSMNFLDRHFIHFYAGPRDTLRFESLSLVNTNPTNSKIGYITSQLDQLNNELLYAETGRLAGLIETKKAAILADNLTSDNPAVNLYLIGHMPENKLLLEQQQLLENQLSNAQGIRETYLTSLRADIGAQLVDTYRQRISLLTILLSLAAVIIAVLGFKLWNSHARFRKHVLADKNNASVQLSPKELEVLRLISTGSSNKEIASALFISMATVKTHVNNIYRKTGVNNRKEARLLNYDGKSTPV